MPLRKVFMGKLPATNGAGGLRAPSWRKNHKSWEKNVKSIIFWRIC